ncbi:uncharacterized protein LOC119293683 [Triticum dicoccoides]|uniref:uncharacterized protein LOC119293683 n=1 Tax=Triticum dicoccoides TaxID=85692 RepID=UPI00188EC06D|nr:uncharacterized protein LOC119293683 [Triticum dicoccoides]
MQRSPPRSSITNFLNRTNLHTKSKRAEQLHRPRDPFAESTQINTMAAPAMFPKATRKASVGGRAWRLLRLAVLWARKGSAAQSLRLLKTLRHSRVGGLGLGHGGRRNDRLHYGEREFSIDETPAFRFRTPSARVLRFIPCIAPSVPDTPGVYGDDRYFFRDDRERDASCSGDFHDDQPSECGLESLDDGADEQLLERAMMEASVGSAGAVEGGEDAGVDVKADEFIAKFYAQMKLQRQISWLQYNEMMERSVC